MREPNQVQSRLRAPSLSPSIKEALTGVSTLYLILFMTHFAMTVSSPTKAVVESIAFSARPGTKDFLDQYRADIGARSIAEALRQMIDEKAVEYERTNW